jgi:hypothetical protein
MGDGDGGGGAARSPSPHAPRLPPLGVGRWPVVGPWLLAALAAAARGPGGTRPDTAHFLGARGSGSGLGASARGYADAHHFMCSGSLELTAPQHTAVTT